MEKFVVFELGKITDTEFSMDELSAIICNWRIVCDTACQTRFCFSIDSSLVVCREQQSVLIYVYARSKDAPELDFLSDVCMADVNDLIMMDIVHFKNWNDFTCARTLMCRVKKHTVYDFFEDPTACS